MDRSNVYLNFEITEEELVGYEPVDAFNLGIDFMVGIFALRDALHSGQTDVSHKIFEDNVVRFRKVLDDNGLRGTLLRCGDPHKGEKVRYSITLDYSEN